MSKRPVYISTQTPKYETKIEVAGHVLTADEPPELGGEDKGPGPFELMLSALGSCMAITMRMYADHKNWPLENVEVKLVYVEDRDPSNQKKNIIEEIVSFRGDMPEQQKQKLVEISKRCPIAKLLKGNIDIISKIDT